MPANKLVIGHTTKYMIGHFTLLQKRMKLKFVVSLTTMDAVLSSTMNMTPMETSQSRLNGRKVRSLRQRKTY
jgi:hypothetical protein